MDFLELWKKFKTNWLYPAGFCFTITVLLFLILGEASAENAVPGITLRQTVCIYGFSLGMAGIGKILSLSIGSVSRYIIHASLSLLDFIVFILLLTGYASKNGFATVGISIGFLFFYGLIMGIRGIFLLSGKEKKNNSKEYSSCFSSKNKH